MSPQKLERDASLVTIRLFDDDMDYLKLTYSGVGYNSVVRALVARHVRKLRQMTVVNLAQETLSKEELQSV